jgi:hypothetical protein
MMNYYTKWMSGMLVVLAMLFTATATMAADRYLPFILAYKGPGDFEAKIAEVKESLEGAGFSIAGDYVPYENAHIVIFTSDALRRVAAQSDMGGFGAAMRASINKVGDEVQVAFVNPEYLAVAYRMKSDLANTRSALEEALGMVQEFGSKELTKRKLGRYNYTFGMEYFDDPYELAEYPSHREALAAVERNLNSNTVGVRPLYRIDIPGKEETIFGVSMRMPEGGSEHMDDTFQMSVVDFEELKQNAYLPYEVMVKGNKVVALHMRFRMAVHFPGLKMMGANSFMKLMSSPEAIRKTLAEAVGGDPS